MRTDIRKFTLRLSFLIAMWLLVQSFQPAFALTESWEAEVASMKQGAVRMIEGVKMMREKKNEGSADKTMKEGHRMMMEAERTLAKIQKDMMKNGAKLMKEGLDVFKTKKDVDEANKLMTQGHEMILEAEKMLEDSRPAKMMEGSRNMMRGLRMRHGKDLSASDDLMSKGRKIMMEAGQVEQNK
jgi:hypothetical protein